MSEVLKKSRSAIRRKEKLEVLASKFMDLADKRGVDPATLVKRGKKDPSVPKHWRQAFLTLTT